MNSEKINFVFSEYVRLQNVLNSYANSSFADFQLLAAIGFLLAWGPLSKTISDIGGQEVDKKRMLFFGFVALAFVFFIIATRDLMKQSIIYFYLQEIQKYEPLVQAKARQTTKGLFAMSTNWKQWCSSTHFPVSMHFKGLMLLFVLAFPTALLWKNSYKMAVCYSIIVLALACVYLHSFSYFPIL